MENLRKIIDKFSKNGIKVEAFYETGELFVKASDKIVFNELMSKKLAKEICEYFKINLTEV